MISKFETLSLKDLLDDQVQLVSCFVCLFDEFLVYQMLNSVGHMIIENSFTTYNATNVVDPRVF